MIFSILADMLRWSTWWGWWREEEQKAGWRNQGLGFGEAAENDVTKIIEHKTT
jgi:hypothetical protein